MLSATGDVRQIFLAATLHLDISWDDLNGYGLAGYFSVHMALPGQFGPLYSLEVSRCLYFLHRFRDQQQVCQDT